MDLYTNKVQSWKISLDQLFPSGSKTGPRFHKHANKNRQEKKIVCTFYTSLVGWKVLEFHVLCDEFMKAWSMWLPIALFKPSTLVIMYTNKQSIAKECTALEYLLQFATTTYVKVKSFEGKYITLSPHPPPQNTPLIVK